jgi:alpha-1,3-mannosyl-glycoprotein beta-1,2-N-acetylglucosaminyltransferase
VIKTLLLISDSFWDDWLREPKQRRDRACIRPEVSRTGMSPEGKIGVSGYGFSYNHFILLTVSIFSGQFYDSYLRKILKNTEPVDWKSIDVGYLLKV